MTALLAVIPARDAVYVAAACGLAAVLDAWLPPTPPGSPLAPLRKILSVLGQNYRNAANLTSAGQKT